MIQDEIPILKMETIPKELQKIKYPPKELFYQGRLELLGYIYISFSTLQIGNSRS